jgi:hypothetical protein
VGGNQPPAPHAVAAVRTNRLNDRGGTGTVAGPDAPTVSCFVSGLSGAAHGSSLGLLGSGAHPPGSSARYVVVTRVAAGELTSTSSVNDVLQTLITAYVVRAELRNAAACVHPSRCVGVDVCVCVCVCVCVWVGV